MRRIENCEIGEIVRPVLHGWWPDGGGQQLWQNQDYHVHRFHIDPTGKDRRHGPHSFVTLTDGEGLGYCMNFGRMVLGRLEPPPSLSELATMPQEFWVSSNGVYYENGLNREVFQKLCAVAQAQGIKVQAARPMRAKTNDRTYSLNMKNINQVSHMPKQATTCLSLIIDSGKIDGITENELAEILRQNGFKLNTKQDPFKIFVFYKKLYVESGILEIQEAE